MCDLSAPAFLSVVSCGAVKAKPENIMSPNQKMIENGEKRMFSFAGLGGVALLVMAVVEKSKVDCGR